MKRMLASSGYTIVEVLIVLAVSGALLISVTALISGQQQKTEFTAALRDFDSRIQDVLNDVGTGTYPELGAGCSVSPGGSPTLGGATAPSGTSQDCVFVGKALQFSPAGTNSQGTLNIYTIVGRRQVGTGAAAREVKDISQAKPVILGTNATQIDASTLNSSLQFKKVLVGGEQTFGLALVSSFGQTSEIDGVISGTSGTALMKLTGVAAGANTDTMKAKVAALAPSDAVTDNVTICIGDPGNSGRIGAVRINGRGTEILFDNDAVAAGCTP